MVIRMTIAIAVVSGVLLLMTPRSSDNLPAGSAHWGAVFTRDDPRFALISMRWASPSQGWVSYADFQAGTSPSTGLLHTQDAGSTWEPLDGPAGEIEFATEQVVWVASGSPNPQGIQVSRTADGGTSWSHWTIGATGLVGLRVVSDCEAWVATRSDGLFHSTDRGAHWLDEKSRLTGSDRMELVGLQFYDSLNGWVIAYDRPHGPGAPPKALVVFRTEDGGKTYTRADLPLPRAASGDLPLRASFPDKSAGWIAFGGAYLLQTIDGGRSWHETQPLVRDSDRGNLYLVDCAFADAGCGWAVGHESYSGPTENRWRAVVLRTTDGGRTWEEVSTGLETAQNSWFHRVQFVDRAHGWIMGWSGVPPSDVALLRREPERVSYVLSYRP